MFALKKGEAYSLLQEPHLGVLNISITFFSTLQFYYVLQTSCYDLLFS